MKILDLEVQKREVIGKAYVKKLRKIGLIPAIVYGMKKDPLLLQIDAKEFEKIFKTGGTGVLNLKFMGDVSENITAMIQEVQKDIIKSDVLHVDLKRISLEEKTCVMVPLHIIGEPSSSGGVLEQHLREVEVECLPLSIPSRIDIDISSLEIGGTMTVADLKLPAEVEILAEPGIIVVSYNEMEEEKPEEEDAALFPTERSEPERIGRKREEED